MYCHPFKIPDEIIAAQEAGKLVIFAGAGLSCGGQSGLPSFQGLTTQIALRLGLTIPSDGNGRPREDYDLILGEWAASKRSLPVHKAARDIIDRSDSRPNPIHRHLLQLFKQPEHVRIVTTNYDRHFASVAEELYHGLLPIYRAPSLPLGHDFHGVVHLHGSVTDRPDRLVLTDADFARAYLSEGWARTFLQSLYAEFNILFVGYSHKDTWVSYLARGMSRSKTVARYALQPSGEEMRWGHLGVHVIPYPLYPEPDAHAPLTLGLERWAQYVAQTPTVERDRIWKIINDLETGAPTPAGEPLGKTLRLTQADEDFLKRMLRKAIEVRWFVQRATQSIWIPWLHEAGLLRGFSAADSQTDLHPGFSGLADWTVNHILSDTSAQALEHFHLLGTSLGPQAWHSVLVALVQGPLVQSENNTSLWDSPHLHHWLVALRANCPLSADHTYLPDLIGILLGKGKPDYALAFIPSLLRVQVEWSRTYKIGDNARPLAAAAKLVISLHEFQSLWRKLRDFPSPAIEQRLLELLSACLGELYFTAGPADSDYDRWAGYSPLIDEPFGGMGPHSAEEFLIVAVLDIIKARATTAGELGEELILRWYSSPHVLWRRLALYALRYTVAISPARKAELILQYQFIYPTSTQLRQDPAALVAHLYGGWDSADQLRVLDHIATHPLAFDDDTAATPEEVAANRLARRGRILSRLSRSHPGEPQIIQTFARLGLPSPSGPAATDFDDDELRPWEARDVNITPKSVDELLAHSPADQLDYFLSFRGSGPNSWSGPNRGGLLAAIGTAANKDLNWARVLMDALLARHITSGDIWQNLAWSFNGIAEDAAFRRGFLLEILPQLNPAAWTLDDWNHWTHLLYRHDEKRLMAELTEAEWAMLQNWSLLAWQAVKPTGTGQAPEELRESVNRAINHPIGRIVEFWLILLSRQRQTQAESPYVWPAPLQASVDELFTCAMDLRSMALALFGQRLPFLRFVVPEWTRTMIYPRLNLAEFPVEAGCLWGAWLGYGRLTPELAADFPSLAEPNRQSLLQGDHKQATRFLVFIASVAVSPHAPVDTLQWVRRLLTDASPEQRGWWLGEVARYVQPATAERQRATWNAWACDFLTNHATTVSEPEFAAFLTWPVAFAAVGPDVLALVRGISAPPLHRLEGFHDLLNNHVITTNPDFVVRYLHWLLSRAQVQLRGAFYLDKIVAKLPVSLPNRADYGALEQQAVRLGMDPLATSLAAKLAAFSAGLSAPPAPND